MVALLISIFLAYLLGSIPTSFIFARLLSGIDIRKHGSGNVGATNVYRVVGKLPGALTLIIDIIKGILAVTVLSCYFYKWGIPLNFVHYQILMALAVVAGHDWTPFLNFKGGKGIATSTGVLLIICPKILLISAIVWVAVFSLTKLVSLASILSSISLPVAAAFFGYLPVTILSIILCVISVFKHRSNIRRLIRGEERRLDVKSLKSW